MKKIIFLFFFSQTLFAQIQNDLLLKDLQFLASAPLEGRKVGTEGNLKARIFIQKRFNDLKLFYFQNDYLQYFEYDKKKAANVVAYLKGTQNPESYIVISAHYDHLGKDGKKIFFGADDNASGTAALLAFAAYFSENPPKKSIIFLATDAEEVGLKGAYHFVKNSPVPLDRIFANINMDMISRNDDKELVACGTYFYPKLKNYFLDTQKYGIKLVFGHDDPKLYVGSNNWTKASDHAAFHEKEIPFIYFGVADHADYHRPTDSFENIHPDFYKKTCWYILDFIKKLDAE